MKSILRTAILTSVLAARLVAAQDQVPWARDFKAACETASEQRRLVLLHFYNDNCPPCTRVEQQVFSQQVVADAVAQNYIPLKVHAGKQPQLAMRYQVQRWPTDVIVTPAGLEVYRAISPQKPDEYIALLNQVALQTGTSAGREWKSSLVARAAATSGPAATLPPSNAAAPFQVAAGSQPFAGSPLLSSTGVASQPFAGGDPRAAQAAPKPSLRSSFVPAESAPAGDAVSAATAPPTANTAATAPGGSPPAPVEPAARSPFLPMENPWLAAAQKTNTPTSSPPSSAEPVPAPPPLPQRQEQPSGQPASANEYTAQSDTAPAPPVVQSPSQPPAGEAASVAAAPAANNTAPATPQVAAPQQIPASQAPPIALGGFCAVTLAEKNAWQKADALFGAIHEGQTYLFVSAAEQQRFLAEPQKYAVPPAGLDGFCPVTLRDNMQWQKGSQQFSATHQGRLYVFTSAALRDRFLADPDAYAPCLSGCDPVRFAQTGELVEGKRAYGLITKDKQRQIFLFADKQTLEQFEKSPAQFRERARQAMLQRSGGSMYR